MKVINVHERKLNVSPTEIGTLIDSLASDNDLLWPQHSWLREAYNSGRSIRFRFLGPIHRWSLWVKILRWIISGGRAHEQVLPNKSLHADAG